MRTHISLPDDVVEAVDQLVGKRKRSAFIAELVRDRVQRERLRAAIRETAGAIKAEDHPEWATSEKVAAWVRKQRRPSSGRQKRLYG